MGRKNKARRHKKFKSDKEAEKPKENNEKGVRKDYFEIVKEHAGFEKYYKLQKICPEEEWSTFMDSIRKCLPTTFRITATRSQLKAFCHILENSVLPDVVSGDADSEDTVKPFKLPWYPDNLAWQFHISRHEIRRKEANYKFHQFLISETSAGNISRQEAVSMIPPLALKVEPHHKVLDMCAAPGSKTAQIIEILQENDGKESEGLLVANDMDNKRCYMLVHQTKRLQSPSFVITNHDAAQFPDIYQTGKDGKRERLKFDRILCDVPCSGDGTMRKNVDLWSKWSSANGLFLHQIQHVILKRGLELLKVGGYLVYSTCSLNPMENEAVIHRVLKEAEGTVSLLDIDIPNLKHSPGLEHWTPCSRDLVGYNSVEEVVERWRTTVRDYVFPPSKEDAPKYQLNKCVRVLSHQQDTGSFFIALLTKTAKLPWEKEEPVEDPVNAEDGKKSDETEQKPENSSKNKGVTKFYHQPGSRAKKTRGFKEDPYFFLQDDDPLWMPLKQFYDFDDSLKPGSFVTRSEGGKKRNVYFVTNLVKDLITQNEKTVKIINTGVKVLVRCGQKWSAADYRLSQEGLKAFIPYIHGRRINITIEDFIILLSNDDETRPPLLETLSVTTQAQLRPLGKGSVILHIKGQMKDNGPDYAFELVGWRGSASLRLYVPKGERLHYLRIVGADYSRFETNKFQELRDTEGNAGDDDDMDVGEADVEEETNDNGNDNTDNGNDKEDNENGKEEKEEVPIKTDVQWNFQ